MIKECGVPRTLLEGKFFKGLESLRLAVVFQLPLPGCVTLYRLLHLSEPCLPLLYKETSNSICLLWWPWRVNDIMQEGTWLQFCLWCLVLLSAASKWHLKASSSTRYGDSRHMHLMSVSHVPGSPLDLMCTLVTALELTCFLYFQMKRQAHKH